jgi:predicted nucleic acid-binding protein
MILAYTSVWVNHFRRGDLQRLPSAIPAEHEEVLGFLEQHRLFGKGITWIDAHLLASALLSRCRLWTLDEHLLKAGAQLRLEYSATN